MHDLLLGTGDGPLMRLVQAYPLPFFFGAFFTVVMIYGLLYPQNINGDVVCDGSDSGDCGDGGGGD